MRRPSKILRKSLKAALGERAYFMQLEGSKERLESVTHCMGTPFGAALIEALEAIEVNAYAQLAEASIFNFPKVIQAKAELKLARYVKAKLMTYVADLDSINEQLRSLYEVEEENLDG